MSVKVIFMRRTPKEKEIFGGDVYIDIDGKNVGKLDLSDLTFQLESGKHKFRMYKSHSFDTFVGFAETEIDTSDGNDLLVKYSPPMLINQPGNILVSDYISSSQIDEMVEEKERKLSTEFNEENQRKAELEEKSRNGTTIFIVSMIIILIIFIFEMMAIYDY